MIFIISDSNDYIVDKTINWLYTIKTNYYYYNSNKNNVEIVKMDLSSFKIKINNLYFDSDKITNYWYKSGKINILKKIFRLK